MNLDIYAGTTILMPHQLNGIRHLWIVVTEPAGDPEQVVIVNITSRKINIETNHNLSDDTVILLPSDHSYITRESVVFYGDARMVEVSALQNAIRSSNVFQFHDDCSDEILKRIKDGIFQSPYISGEIENYCREQFYPSSF
jgi:hypothetical protein